MIQVLIGIVAALAVCLPELLMQKFSLTSPALLLGVGLFGAMIQRGYFSRTPASIRVYDGMADLFIHIHARYVMDSAWRWFYRGCISFVLMLCGGVVGPEGAAAEFSQTLAVGSRSRSEKWSEQKRRTDVACALAAGLSAAFQAPFAAIIFCFEVGTGGRALSAILSSITSYISVLFISRRLGLEMEWVSFFKAQALGRYDWPWMVVIGAVGGLAGFGLVRVFRFYQESVVDLFSRKIWLRAIFGSIIIAIVSWLFSTGHTTPLVELTQIIEIQRPLKDQLAYLLSEMMILSTVLASFGTVGIFWPLFTIGALIGNLLIPGVVGIFVGGAAIFAGVLGAPLTAAVLALEMTRDWRLMAGTLITGFVANQVRMFLKQAPLVHKHLEARGLSLLDGRSESVLASIKVSDAMVTDHASVYEHELLKDLSDKFLNSKHPFLPVVNRSECYVGLLTLDLLQEGLETMTGKHAFFEVKDLLYKSQSKVKTVHFNENLATTSGVFGDLPCVAVVDDSDKVLGLLFAYSVRAAYDREVARRALNQNRAEESGKL